MNDEIIGSENERTSGRTAQKNNILAAKILAETVKTTLGPKGMDKMLVDRAGEITITNDGVTILEEMEVEHPVAKILVDVAKTQEQEVGDGTTTAVMLAGKLLENAEKLLNENVHPTIIAKGYRLAQEKAKEILKGNAIEVNTEEELIQIAKTAMTGKGVEFLKEHFSKIIVDAVKKISQAQEYKLEDIRIEKQKGESIEQTKLVEGLVLSNERVSIDMPVIVEAAKIALIEESLEVRSPETEARISISSPEQLQQFINQEDFLLKKKVEIIKKSGANVLFCQKGIDELVQFNLAKEGIFAVRRVPKSDIRSLSKATHAKIYSQLNDIQPEGLGTAEIVEELSDGENNFIQVRGCENPHVLTILIRGGTDHLMDEVERAIKDALGDVFSIMKDSKVLAGGGAIEVEVAKELRNYSQSLSGREQLAIEEFANSLEFIPRTLAENAGLDSIDTITELKSIHDTGNSHFGLNLFTGKIEDTANKGIIEPLKIKTQAIGAATEAAIMILRIDDVIAAKPKKRTNTSKMLDYD